MFKKTAPLLFACVLGLISVTFAQKRAKQSIPPATLLLITRVEDERRWDDDLRNLLSSPNAAVRRRAALAAGRIGNEGSVAALANLLETDNDAAVRSMAAFALGEVESAAGANVLLTTLKNTSVAENSGPDRSKRSAKSRVLCQRISKRANVNSASRSSTHSSLNCNDAELLMCKLSCSV